MGVCYTYLLYDDFDWSYSNLSKENTITALKEDLPVAEVLTQWNNYIVVDLDKNSPWGENVQKLKKYCNSAYYYGDSSQWDLKQVEFKEDPIEVTNKPVNRNKEY